MGFIAPAIPWIAKGAALLGGHLAAKKAQSSAMKRTPEEQVALGGAQQAGGELAQTGTALTQSGVEATTPAQNYYSTLLHGNRALQSQATAAARGGITDTYTGAERGLEKSGVQGAARDVAAGELQRQKAGQIAGLVTGVQPGAAAALGQMGAEQTSQGGQRTSSAGSLYANLLPQGMQNRMYGRQEGEKAGSSIGGFLFDVLSSGLGGKKGGVGGLLPSRQTTPNTGFLPSGGTGMSGY